jgi:hypothetical protein
MRFRKWNKIIILFMFENNFNQILKFSFPVKDLSLPVYNIFLQVKCDVLRYAEILHCIGHNYSHFITDPEKMIYPCFACKNHSGEVENIDFLLTKILYGDPLNLVKRFKVNF